MPMIQPERLTQIRRIRGFGRPLLAKLSGLTDHQIADMEGAEPADCTEDTILRLASVLKVRPELLTGSGPLMIEDIMGPQHPRSCSCCS